MAKAYWVSCYRAVSDPTRLVQYANMARPVVESHGGRILARGNPEKT